jgi:cytoskeletal protein CcmA (bactofilin family)
VDLQDIKVMSPFSRNFRTHGHLTIGPKGVCNSVRAECGSARIEGELGGNLTCSGDLELRSKGRILGSIKARRLLVHKKAEVQFGRAIRAVDVEIEGSLTADIQAEGTVRLKRSGRLQGSVTAKSFIIENGAVFDGKVTISPPDMPGLHSLLLADGTLHRARPTTASTSGRSQQAPPGETLELPLGE